jgi:hypothetical protein
MALRTRLNAIPRRPAAPEEPPAPRKSSVTPARVNKKQVAFFVDRETKRQLDRLALDEDRNLQSVMLEACNLLFQSRGLARIAEQKD